ncbi:MAG: hypothetical protein R3D05_05100 [Dongiaceae bacterium]
MSTDKSDKVPEAPEVKEPAVSQGFDLFKTFRHPPKVGEPIRAPKAPVKSKK